MNLNDNPCLVALEESGMIPGRNCPKGYEPLASVLLDALLHAAEGKGIVRHGNNRAFLDQPMLEITRMVGLGFVLGQAMKKAQESRGMVRRKEFDAARNELLGAINYLAGAVLVIDEWKEER